MIKIFQFFLYIILNFLFIVFLANADERKIKIGLLAPLTGDNSKLGNQIVKSVQLALKDINSDLIEIFPRDTQSNPDIALRSAIELQQNGINLVIGPIFYENLVYLDEVQNLTFLSFTNKTLGLPKNVISTGINSTSQLNTIKKFIKQNEIKKTIF